MIAPPGYPNSTSTPASTRVRQRMCAPLKDSLIASDSPVVGGVQRLILERVGMARLVEGVHQCPSTGLDNVRGCAVAGKRFPVDPHLHHYLPQAVPPRGHRLH